MIALAIVVRTIAARWEFPIAGFTEPDAYKQLPDPVEQTGIAGLLNQVRGVFQQLQRDPFYAVVAYKDFKPQR